MTILTFNFGQPSKLLVAMVCDYCNSGLLFLKFGADSQENGTCATLVPLFDMHIEDLNVHDLQSHFLNVEPLSLTNILHSSDEAFNFKENLIFTLLQIIIKYGGEGFKRFEKDLEKYQPVSDYKIEKHHTELFPSPAWQIDESSIIGNAEVDQAIVSELRLNDVPESKDRVCFLAGDQLSLARLQSLEVMQVGQEGEYHGFFWGTWIAGLFHAKIADAHGTLLTHFGLPNTGEQNPGSLWFHNTRLDCIPITLTSLPSFCVCRDLIYVSLYAQSLHCLVQVSGLPSLEEYLADPDLTWDKLVQHATIIYEKFAQSLVVDDLRWKRRNAHGDEKAGDMIFENAVLFMRDALISHEFTDAIKASDSRHVVLVLKAWALSFHGNGRTKYAFEMLHLIHNITKVWSKKMRYVVILSPKSDIY